MIKRTTVSVALIVLASTLQVSALSTVTGAGKHAALAPETSAMTLDRMNVAARRTGRFKRARRGSRSAPGRFGQRRRGSADTCNQSHPFYGGDCSPKRLRQRCDDAGGGMSTEPGGGVTCDTRSSWGG